MVWVWHLDAVRPSDHKAKGFCFTLPFANEGSEGL